MELEAANDFKNKLPAERSQTPLLRLSEKDRKKMTQHKCSCGCGCDASKTREYKVPTGNETTLDELPVGMTATIVKVLPDARGRKKFADIGLVPGTELLMEAHAPFGGLLRVKIMETSMALHRDDAANFVIKKEEAN